MSSGIMKILFLVQADHGTTTFDRFYEAIGHNIESCDLRWLSSNEQENLKIYFKTIDTSAYDRILFFIRFKKELKQVKFIQTVPNLVILEYDAFQNYIDCKYKGKFSGYYQKLPWARVISTGAMVTEKLKQEGFDAHFISKGYDASFLHNLNISRDVELAFVGSVNHSTYSQRKQFLDALKSKENMLIQKTKTFENYRQLLNRVRFFISADIGFGEYMQKNFEAMACGCILFAYRQGSIEEEALGLKDMVNVVLYSSMEELLEKLSILRSDTALADSVAMEGQSHAEKHFTFDAIGQKIAEAIAPNLRRKRVKSFLGFKKYEWDEAGD